MLRVIKTTGVCGGHACIRNTRIAVWTLISLTNQGMSDDDLIEEFPGLTYSDLLAAKLYYRANLQEINGLISSHHSDRAWDV